MMFASSLLAPLGFQAARFHAMPVRPERANAQMATGEGVFTMSSGGSAATIMPVEGGSAASGDIQRCDDTGCETIELAPVTFADVTECQKKWANAIASISATYLAKGDYVAAAGEAAGELYGYGHTEVLFKPTKATKNPFRPDGASAMSYFVGADAMNNDKYKGEDAGFAINGGKGWSKVVFNNHNTEYHGKIAIAMGSYDFTCATTGDVATVEYTFGYKRCDDGKVRISLHHSSVPYSP